MPPPRPITLRPPSARGLSTSPVNCEFEVSTYLFPHTSSIILTSPAGKKAKRAAIELLVLKTGPGKSKAAPLRNFKKRLERNVDKREDAIERHDRRRAAIIDRLVGMEDMQANYEADEESMAEHHRYQNHHQNHNHNQGQNHNHQSRGSMPHQQADDDLNPEVGGSKMILEIIGGVVNYGWYITFPA
jgi:hypothetical protein